MFKRSVVIKAKKIRPLPNISPDYKSIIFFTLFVCGLIIGAIIIKNSETDFITFFSKLLNNQITAKGESSWFKCFCGDFLWLFIFVFVDFICGLCAVGFPFVCMVPLVFGCYSGMVISAFFVNYGLVGLGYCAIMNLPYYAITAATLVKCCCESTQMSNEIFFYSLGVSKNENRKPALIKEYGINYVLLCIPIIVAATISTVSFKLFSGLFNIF